MFSEDYQRQKPSCLSFNNTYGRQRISPPMLIVAQLPKNPASKAKFSKQQTFFAWRFCTLYVQKISNPRPLLSISLPTDSNNLKCFKIGLWEVGTKRRLKNLLKTFLPHRFYTLYDILKKSNTSSFHYFSPRILKI